MPTVAYLTHSLWGERDTGDGSEWSNDLAHAMDWCSFVTQATHWAICCPWYAHVILLQEADPRLLLQEADSRSKLDDQVKLVEKCDILVMVGGHMRAHMSSALHAAQRRIGRAVPVLDLLHLGAIPPWDLIDQVRQDIRAVTASLELE